MCPVGRGLGCRGEYAIGAFDGKAFTTEVPKQRFHYGSSFYASQTFGDIPPCPENGRRIQIAWGRSGHPAMPFNQMMNFPVELTLRTTDEGLRLFALPVKEVEKLHAKKHAWKDAALKEGENLLAGLTGDLFDLRAEIEPGSGSQESITRTRTRTRTIEENTRRATTGGQTRR